MSAEDKAPDAAEQQALAASVQSQEEAAGRGRMRFGLAALALIGWTASAVALTVFALRPQGATHGVQVGMVDIPEIMETIELKFTALVTRPGASDADRGEAYDLVKASAPALETLVAGLQRDCDCLLLTRAAVVAGSHVTDYTREIKVAMGIDQVDVAALKKALEASMALDLPGRTPRAMRP